MAYKLMVFGHQINGYNHGTGQPCWGELYFLSYSAAVQQANKQMLTYVMVIDSVFVVAEDSPHKPMYHYIYDGGQSPETDLEVLIKETNEPIETGDLLVEPKTRFKREKVDLHIL